MIKYFKKYIITIGSNSLNPFAYILEVCIIYFDIDLKFLK